MRIRVARYGLTFDKIAAVLQADEGIAMWLRRYLNRRRQKFVQEVAKIVRDQGAPPVDVAAIVRDMLVPVTINSQPNINDLVIATRNLDAAALNLKAYGYHLARSMAASLPVATKTAPEIVGLKSKLSTQADIESSWVAHWCSQLKIPVVYHRKIWELSYVLQAIYESGGMNAGYRGLGFGCGVEPIPSYLASLGVEVTMTDLPPDDVRAREWSATAQHAEAVESAWQSHLVGKEDFQRLVSGQWVDMNHIPDGLTGYDFCWSVCALEHLGSIDLGLRFIERSLDTLRLGGLAVHTFEFNINPDGPTVDNWPTVFFQSKHLESLAERLTAAGHSVALFDFDPGDKPMDNFIDLPPWPSGSTMSKLSEQLGQPYHLKVAADGFVVTCAGMVVRKRDR